MNVGFFSPLPPARTGVADYSASLMRYLGRLVNVEVAPAHASVNLYHLGNNQLHSAIYGRALAEPGVVVLHDAVLHHFFLGSFTQEQYIEEFAYTYGEWSRNLAQELWATRARSGADSRYFQYSLVKRIAETSKAVIVHNPAAREIVLREAPRARVYEIPHLALPGNKASVAAVYDMRRELGVRRDMLLVGLFGHLRESKRLMAVLRVCRRLQSAVRLVLAGPCDSRDLRRAMEPYLDEVIRLDFLPEERLWLLAETVDLCLNLRYPSAGETSAISIRLMQVAKPVVMTKSLETSRFPEHTCIKVDSGLNEEDEIEEVMRWLSRAPLDGAAIGQRAQDYVEHHHSPERVAQMYKDVLCEHC